MPKEIIITGNWDKERLDALIYESWMIHKPDKQIAFLSEHFLGVQYKEHTLLGDADTEEVFVINLGAVDCFTFLEYIEAMRLSDSFTAFKYRLKRIRYQNAIVDYYKRNHFFTDWKEYNFNFVSDVTNQAGDGKAVIREKILNLKEDGTLFLEGIESRLRVISYIPSELIDDKTTAALKTGDYVGIYSEKSGLDVSHVGILVKNASIAIFRHASSEYKEVVEQDFLEYVAGKPGIIIIRPLTVSGPTLLA